jgi:hypothetical protein
MHQPTEIMGIYALSISLNLPRVLLYYCAVDKYVHPSALNIVSPFYALLKPHQQLFIIGMPTRTTRPPCEPHQRLDSLFSSPKLFIQTSTPVVSRIKISLTLRYAINCTSANSAAADKPPAKFVRDRI